MDYRYKRHLMPLVEEALGYARVVLLIGPRQAGKSTLAAELVRQGRLSRTISLDNELNRRAASSDPTGFVAGLDAPVVIDEVQRAPDLLLAIKQAVDSDKAPGRFLLTGSANILTAPRVLDALTGRADVLRLLPLSISEIEGGRGDLVDSAFAGEPPRIQGAPIGLAAWLDRALAGGYPEALERPEGRARSGWFESYRSGLINRDLRDIADARKLAQVPQLLRQVATQVGGPVIVSRLSQKSGISARTVEDYLKLLETLFLVRRLLAWRPGIASRERHASKYLLTDSGLLGNLLDLDAQRVSGNPGARGALFENFVSMELIKHAEWAEKPVTPLHYRRDNREVDLILERQSGEMIAVEAKASATLGPSDWKPLKELRDAQDDNFRAGIIFFTGADTVPLGDRLWAVPVSGLWQ